MKNKKITNSQLQDLLPVFTDCIEDRMAQYNKTDFLLLTDNKDVVNILKKKYTGDSNVQSFHLFEKRTTFTQNYNLWLVYTSGAHPHALFRLKRDDQHVEQFKFLTRPKDFKSFVKETQNIYNEFDWSQFDLQ